MAKSLRPAKTRLSRDATRLISLCEALHASGSRVEDQFWENQIGELLHKIFKSGNDQTLEAVLDHLSDAQSPGLEVLLEQAETTTESFSASVEGVDWDVLMITAPITIWTRYQLPTNLTLHAATRQKMIAALKETILMPDTKVELFPKLLVPDEMPHSFAQTCAWLQRLGQRALGLKSALPELNPTVDPPGLLADSRHLVLCVASMAGQPLFRWQSDEGEPSRSTCLAAWEEASRPLFAGQFTGCQFDVLLPDAYYVSMRDADKQIRPIAIQAATDWLESALGMPASSLRASLMGLGDKKVQEYRIGFSTKGNNDVVYGTVWPLFEPSEDPDGAEGSVNVADEIAAVLKAAGVGEVRKIPGLGPLEYCEDCAAPLFPNPLGELVHAELPEDATHAPAHLH